LVESKGPTSPRVRKEDHEFGKPGPLLAGQGEENFHQGGKTRTCDLGTVGTGGKTSEKKYNLAARWSKEKKLW